MAEVRLPAPVKATHVVDLDSEAGKVAGAFELDGDGILIRCPCGCGKQYFLDLITIEAKERAGSRKPGASSTWGWDGNAEAPTLVPSINDTGHWHGYLRVGMWVQA